MPPVATLSRPAPVATVVRAPAPDLSLLRKGVFFYLILWVFEGTLRKWLLPGLSNPLLVVRDPVLLGLYVLAFAKGVFPRNAFIFWIGGLGFITTLASLALTQAPLAVTLYGLRSNFLHLPLIFLLPNVLTKTDLRVIAKYALLIALGMSVLVFLQFRSGPDAFLNRGAGDGAKMLDSAFGRIRPSGTFSYTNGLGGFTALTTAFFLQHLLEKRVVPRLLWLASAPALLTMIMLSGSRAAIAGIGLLVGGVILISLVQVRYWASSLKLVGIVWLIVTVVGSVAVFHQGLDVFSKRFETNKVERTGLVGRYLDIYLQPIQVMDRAEAAGVGLGMGTNVAAGLTVGQRKFMFSEGEGGRVVLESGPVLGLAFLLLRFCLMVYVAARALRALRADAATLPTLLLIVCYNDLLIGQFAQATELGYATIAAGLCLAACRTAGKASPEEAESEITVVEPINKRSNRTGKAAGTQTPATVVVATPPGVVPMAVATRPGRSAYAQRLHAASHEGSGGEKP